MTICKEGRQNGFDSRTHSGRLDRALQVAWRNVLGFFHSASRRFSLGVSMDLWDFVQAYIKTKVDWDKKWGPQCVDLPRQYWHDVWGFPKFEGVDGAKDLVLKYNQMPTEKEYLCLVSDPKSGRQGDVVVFGATEKNEFGHVAIVLDITMNYLVVFEQDGFKKDGAKIGKWRYNNVIGYLRPWSEV